MLNRIAVVCAVTALACAPEGSPLAPTRAPSSARVGEARTVRELPGAESASPDAAGIDAELALFKDDIAEYVRALDIFESALAHPQTPPKHFNAARLNRKLQGRFENLRFRRAAGYLYWNDAGPMASFNHPGCRFGVLTKDGVPCSSALVPPVELSLEAAFGLLESVSKEPVPSVTKYCMCGGKSGPMHSFVFYDEQDTPIATITLNLSYHELRTAPDDGHGQSGLSHTSLEFRDWYQSFCKAIGMPLCVFWDIERQDAFTNLVRERRIRRPERSPLQFIADQPLNELDQHSRRLLCAFAHRETFRTPSASSEGTFGRESDSGEVWIGRTLPWYDCERQFPSCKDKLYSVWPCALAAIEGDPGFFEPEVSYCAEHADCIWGFADQWRGTRAAWDIEEKRRQREHK